MSSKKVEGGAIRRRRFILNCLTEDGAVSLDQIRQKGLALDSPFPTAFQSITDDFEYLGELLGISIARVNLNGKTVWMNSSHPKATASAKAARLLLREDEKLAMAWLLGGVVLGARLGESYSVVGPKTPVDSHLHKIVDPKWIMSELEKQGKSELVRKLKLYWSQHARRIAIDTGSSLEIFASQVLAKLKVPSDEVQLSFLEVLTNSRSIFYHLGNPKYKVKTLCMGGGQEQTTEAICGHLAEVFLENSGLNFGLAVVGTTAIDIAQRKFGSDHFRDGKIKSMLLDRAMIRVVLADSSKFLESTEKSYTEFAAISSDCVDLIVTDKIPEPGQNHLNIKQALADCGVALLELPPEYLERAKKLIESERDADAWHLWND